jgi:hypothetical protein
VKIRKNGDLRGLASVRVIGASGEMIVLQGRPGTFLVGDLVAGDAIRQGMVVRVTGVDGVINGVPILAVEFVDHRAERTSELGLHVVGDAPEERAAIEALEGEHLIEITERPA